MHHSKRGLTYGAEVDYGMRAHDGFGEHSQDVEVAYPLAHGNGTQSRHAGERGREVERREKVGEIGVIRSGTV